MQALQLEREQWAQSQAQLLASAREKRAVQTGHQSRTAYGMKLFRETSTQLATELNDRLARWTRNPASSTLHGQALPLLARIGDPRRLTVVALPVVLDRITEPTSWESLAERVGRAIEREVVAVELRAVVGDAWFQEFRRRYRLLQRGGGKALRRLADKHGLATVRWTAGERFQAGALVVDCVVAATGLLEVERRGKDTLIRPSLRAKQLIMHCGPRAVPPSYSPMLCPPQQWEDLHGGGMLLEEEALIRPPKYARLMPGGGGLAHLEGLDLPQVLAGANALQAVRLRVDPTMAEVQADTFHGNNRRVWEVTIEPVVLPPRPATGGEEVMKVWRRQFAMAKEREALAQGARVRIPQQIAAAMELRGQTLWQACYLDYRGRAYTRNRLVSHQGPDHQKALLEFAQGEVCGESEARWLLVAAANHHWGGRVTWRERLQRGLELREKMRALAEDPIGRTELWCNAKEPWQFLQVALAWAAWEKDPSEPCRCPIRFDQTTSGPGILAALLRDRSLALACNMTGSEPSDLYGVVLAQVQRELQLLAFQADHQWQRDAAAYLAPLVGREQMKTATMAAPYGASLQGLRQELAEWLFQLGAGRRDIRGEVMDPAGMLSSLIYRRAKAATQTAMQFRSWFNKFTATVLAGGRPVQWSSPTGLLVSCGVRSSRGDRVHTAISGSFRVVTAYEPDPDAEVSARDTRKGLTANLIHSFDAALASRMASRCGEAGAPLLANHDCFATLPTRAEWLHRELLAENRRLYREDWLVRVVAEIAERGQVPVPKKLPVVGTLDPEEIGTNPYLYG